jgi:hypothetical protein
VATNRSVFFGNFGNSTGSTSLGDTDWHHGIEADAVHFVSRFYYLCDPTCGVDSPNMWSRAVQNHFHHIATNHVNDDDAPWSRTHNVHGYPFCPLGIQPCDQQFLNYIEGGGAAGRLYAFTVRSGDLETGQSTTDNFVLAADRNSSLPPFVLTGFITAPSSHVNDWAKACLMVRGGASDTAPYYAACRAADNHGPFVQYRALGCSGTCGTAYTNSSFGEDGVFVRIEVEQAEAMTTVRGFASIDDNSWQEMGQAVTFPGNLDLVGFAASSHGDKPVKFLFGGMKFGALGSAPAAYEPDLKTFEIGDSTLVSLEDIARPR